jgi:hypothetical protein
MGLDSKTYWLTDRQWQCDFNFDFDLTGQVAPSRAEASSRPKKGTEDFTESSGAGSNYNSAVRNVWRCYKWMMNVLGSVEEIGQ